MRFKKINDYYLEDQLTGKKITFTEACKLLNNYEEQNKKRTVNMNLDNQILQAIKRDKVYCKQQLEKEDNPHVRQKIEKYIEELSREEQKILNTNYQLKDPIQ